MTINAYFIDLSNGGCSATNERKLLTNQDPYFHEWSFIEFQPNVRNNGINDYYYDTDKRVYNNCEVLLTESEEENTLDSAFDVVNHLAPAKDYFCRNKNKDKSQVENSYKASIKCFIDFPSSINIGAIEERNFFEYVNLNKIELFSTQLKGEAKKRLQYNTLSKIETEHEVKNFEIQRRNNHEDNLATICLGVPEHERETEQAL